MSYKSLSSALPLFITSLKRLGVERRNPKTIQCPAFYELVLRMLIKWIFLFTALFNLYSI